MRLKKLILPLLGLFILGTAFAGIPKLTFKAAASGNEVLCNFEEEKPENEAVSLTDKSYKFKVGKYAGTVPSFWTLLGNAIQENDKTARELLKYCVRSNPIGATNTNREGVSLLIAASYFDNDNARDIIKYLIKDRGWDVDHKRMFISVSRTALAATAEADIIKSAELLVGFNANPYVEIYDNGKDIKVIDFAKEKSPSIYAFLKTIKETAALMKNSFHETIHYTLTDKNEFSRLMEKVKSNGIVADFLRVLDSNSLLNTTYNNLI